MKGSGLRIAETFLEKKNQFGRLTLPDFKTYYHSVAVKRLASGQPHRPMDQQSPRIDSCFCGQLNAKASQWRRDSLSNKRCWNNCVFICKIMNLYPYLTLYKKANSKWMTDPDATTKTTKFLE